MLELRVVPEQCIGNDQWDFVLGMHLGQIIAIIKSQAKHIHGVQIIVSDNPLAVDTMIDLSDSGIRLLFCSRSQRLKRIEVYDMSRVKLKYYGQFFSNEALVIPSIQQIERTFGPTKPAIMNPDGHSMTLSFRGVCFLLRMDTSCDADSPAPTRSEYQEYKYSRDTEPIVTKMLIYSGDDPRTNVPPQLPVRYFHGNVYAESVCVLRDGTRTTGVEVSLMYEAPGRADGEQVIERKKSIVSFGDGTQAVQSALGSPCKVFYKCEDKLRIHSASPHRNLPSKSDYFYNYFTLGMDVLFDATCHTVKKFILHTNFPGHYYFEIYHRCNFRLHLTSASESSASLFQQDANLEDSLIVDPCTKWTDILALHEGQKPGTPLVLCRASSTNGVNPFAPSMCYNFQNIIFETIQESNHIASLTLYPGGDQQQ